MIVEIPPAIGAVAESDFGAIGPQDVGFHRPPAPQMLCPFGHLGNLATAPYYLFYFHGKGIRTIMPHPVRGRRAPARARASRTT
jgi:hypothetical protein